MWQRRVLADISAVPWRNGHGYTKVISEGRTDSGLQWRLSVADLIQDAPFSIFPGWRRSFALLGQASLTLSEKNGNWNHLVKGSAQPFHFSGDDSVKCSGIDAPVQALNLMVRPNIVSAESRFIFLKEEDFTFSDIGGSQFFLVPSIGAWDLYEGKLNIRMIPGEIWSSSPLVLSKIFLRKEKKENLLFFIRI